MSFEILYRAEVIECDLPKLDTAIKARIKLAIGQKLISHPEVYGIPLRQSLKNYRKLRVGDYRIIFKIQGKKVIVVIIEHRSVVYKQSRIRLDDK